MKDTLFESVKEAVCAFVNDIEKQFAKELNVERIKNSPEIYVAFFDFKDCGAQVTVNQPEWAPYRYVYFEVVSMLDEKVQPIFVWYDSDKDDINSIIENLRSGIEYAINYTSPKAKKCEG